MRYETVNIIGEILKILSRILLSAVPFYISEQKIILLENVLVEHRIASKFISGGDISSFYKLENFGNFMNMPLKLINPLSKQAYIEYLLVHFSCK